MAYMLNNVFFYHADTYLWWWYATDWTLEQYCAVLDHLWTVHNVRVIDARGHCEGGGKK